MVEDKSTEETHAEMQPEEQIQEDQEDLALVCKRLQADFDNYRRRVEEEKADIRKRGAERLVTDLLPVIDALHLSLQHVNNDDLASIKQTLIGIEFIDKQLKDTLSNHGLKMLHDINIPFDPYKHEAVEKRSNASCDQPTVVEVKSPGYLLGDKVLRHAKVVVETNDTDSAASAASDTEENKQ